MASEHRKPIIFLAYANDWADQGSYLRSLPEEAKRIHEVLEQAGSAGLCEVVERSNATLKDILDVFQDRDRRDRIAIFHYAGHANGYELLLEAESGESEASRLQAANAAGLAEFLGQQAGIQLVFLNGCATQQQAQGLFDAQVASVIAMSRSIDDRWAMVFASRFYQGLASGAAIRTAFNEAAAAVKTESGGSQRHLYAVQDNACYRLPWDLYIRPGADTAIHWNLPDAADNPLFGLPKPPAQDLPPEPFRHLDWFRRKDAEIFFGREYQIRDLYQRVTDTTTPPLILLYGQSGVGKSSVLEAGLLPRLERDHAAFYIRVTGLAFIPGSKVMASWGQDGKILLWDVSDARAPRFLGEMPSGHPDRASAVAYMPGRGMLASGDWDGRILLRDLSDPRAPKALGELVSANPGGVGGLVFVPERNVLASWGSNAAQDRDDILLWQMDWVALQTEACRIVNRDLTDVEWRQYLGSYCGEKRTHETCADILGADVQLRGKQDTTRQQKQ